MQSRLQWRRRLAADEGFIFQGVEAVATNDALSHIVSVGGNIKSLDDVLCISGLNPKYSSSLLGILMTWAKNTPSQKIHTRGTLPAGKRSCLTDVSNTTE